VSFGPTISLNTIRDARRRIACNCLGLLGMTWEGRLFEVFPYPVRKIHSVVAEQHQRLVGRSVKFLVLLDTCATSGMWPTLVVASSHGDESESDSCLNDG
jgi:hypothetical protein